MAKISQLPLLAAPNGDELVPVEKGGGTWRAPLAKLALGLVIPIGTVTVTQNTPAGTEYAVAIPTGFEPLADRAYVDFVVPETSAGPVSLTIGTMPVRELFSPAVQPLRAGWTVRAQKNDGGGKWDLVSQTPQGLDLIDAANDAALGLHTLAEVIGVPLARTVSGNPNEIFVDFGLWQNDLSFEAYVLKTNTGPVTLHLASGNTRLLDLPAGALKAGTIVRFTISFGINGVVVTGSRPVTKLEDGSALAGLVEALGVPLAKTIAGNSNEIFVDFDQWQNDVSFEAYILKTNTGPVTLTMANGRTRVVQDAPAGALVEGSIARFTISLGIDGVILTGSRPIQKLADFGVPEIDPWDLLDSRLTHPYGDVQLGGDGKPVFTPRTLRIVGRGSSVVTDDTITGREGAAPPGQAPVAVLGSLLGDAFGSAFAIQVDNWSHGGHVASQAESQWNEAMAGSTAPVDILFDGFGMNDMAMASYNAGQVSPHYLLQPQNYEAELKRRLDGGVKRLILCTSPHPHTGRMTNTFGGNPMTWPYFKAAPVGPEELVPPLSESVIERDWTGSGVKRPGDARGQHVNEMIRDVARRLHRNPRYRGRIFLLDVEWAWFRYGVEVHALDLLFEPGQIVHPNLLGHQVSYQRCAREFVAASRRGFGDQWCFRGEAA